MNYTRLRQIFDNSFDEDDSDDLFRVLPSREVSPPQWDKQIKFWSTVISQWAADSAIVEVRVGDLVKNLTWNDIVPPLFPTIRFLISTKTCKLTTDFKHRSAIRRIATSLMKMISPVEITNDTTIIFQNNLRILCNNIRETVINRASMLSDVILTEIELKELSKGVDINVITEFMIKEKIAEKIGNGFFFDDNSHDGSTREIVLAMHNSKALLERLNKLESEVEPSVEKQRRVAVNYERSGRHKDALTAYKRYKLENDKLEKTTRLRSRIEMSIFDLNKADINTSIVKGMKAINKISKEKINIDNLDDIVDKYDETVEMNDEISRIIGRSPEDEFSEGELEKELNDLCGTGEKPIEKEVTPKYEEEPVSYAKVSSRPTRVRIAANA